MEFPFLLPPSSSTRKMVRRNQEDFDENGICLKLSLGPPSSIDLKLSLQPTPVKKKICHVCNCTRTPIWRTGPLGRQTLCNACGLQYRKFDERRNACLAAGIPMFYPKAIDHEFAKLVGEN